MCQLNLYIVPKKMNKEAVLNIMKDCFDYQEPECVTGENYLPEVQDFNDVYISAGMGCNCGTVQTRYQGDSDGKTWIEIKKEIAQEKMQVSMLCGAYLELYNGEQKAQSKIEQWQIVESKYEYTYEYCENTEEFKNSTICTAIKEGGSSVVELALMPVITFREYTEPTFTLNCNPTTLKHNEKTTCELIVNTQTEITEIKTDINTGDLIIKELKPEEGWTIEKE